MINTKRVYENKLTKNLKDFDKEVKKEIVDTINGVLLKQAKINKGKLHITKTIITSNEKENLMNILKVALCLDETPNFTEQELLIACDSALTFKGVSSGKNTKSKGWAKSVSVFLNSLNWLLVKTLTKEVE